MNKKYTRYELHQQCENGKWRKVFGSNKETQEEAMIELVQKYQKLHECDNRLRMLLPAGFLHRGQLRLAECKIEVVQEFSPESILPKAEA